MFIFDEQSGTVSIGNITMTIKDFMLLQPDYSYPVGQSLRYYDGETHWHVFEGRKKRLPVPWRQGDKYLASQFNYLNFVQNKEHD